MWGGFTCGGDSDFTYSESFIRAIILDLIFVISRRVLVGLPHFVHCLSGKGSFFGRHIIAGLRSQSHKFIFSSNCWFRAYYRYLDTRSINLEWRKSKFYGGVLLADHQCIFFCYVLRPSTTPSKRHMAILGPSTMERCWLILLGRTIPAYLGCDCKT